MCLGSSLETNLKLVLFQVLEVYDANRLTRDDFLGLIELNLNHIAPETEDRTPHNYLLKPRSSKSNVRGHLQVGPIFKQDPNRY